MTEPISFDPFLAWVDATDPDNLPVDVRIIGAADLLRYENFGVAATSRINSLITDTEGIDDRLVELEEAAPITSVDIGFARKPTSTTRTNTTTLAEDPGLTLDMPASVTVEVEAVIFYTTPTTADIRLGFTGTGVTQTYFEVSGGVVFGPTNGYVPISGSGIQQAVVMKGLVSFGSGTTNTLAVHWAQDVLDAGNTVVHHSSYMKTYVVP